VQPELAQLWLLIVRERLWRVRVSLQNGASREDDRAGGNVPCSREIWSFEVGEPFGDFVWFRIGEEQADLALYALT
jgi:hypothetical protein